MLSRRFRLPLPVDLRATLAPLCTGRRDPTIQVGRDTMLRASRTPDGPATLLARIVGGEVEASAWGPGADRALAALPSLLGADDDLTGFAPVHPGVDRAYRRVPGLRVVSSGQVADLLVPTILAQKVTGLQAARAWLGMIRAFGEPAPAGPGPGGRDGPALRLPPAPAALAAQPYWAYHRFGVERRRAETIIRACRRIDRLEEAATMSREDALRRLTALDGIGVWTANRVLRFATGDADAVEVGDYHVPDLVTWNLAGEPRGDDARMLDLLRPYAGHRGRVVLLLGAGGQRPPRYGPRLSVHAVERL